jgi:D-lyxose ketol-isomerase
MKRSEINKILLDTIQFMKERQFYPPPFVFWTLSDWHQKGPEISEIISNQLGWDITDFGGNNFLKLGLVLITLRNGRIEDIPKGGKPYAEKVLFIEEEQITPMHFHFHKQEDIINRGGGILVVQVYNSTSDNKLADTPVTVSCDGIVRTVKAGDIIELTPGESITLVPRLYHKFWGKKGTGKILVTEVSSVNDDRTDNFFLEKLPRFSDIIEDEPPKHLLYADYEKFIQLENILKRK